VDRDSLRHDAALEMAKRLLSVIAPCLRPEEHAIA
jgi:hypothetical protein